MWDAWEDELDGLDELDGDDWDGLVDGMDAEGLDGAFEEDGGLDAFELDELDELDDGEAFEDGWDEGDAWEDDYDPLADALGVSASDLRAVDGLVLDALDEEDADAFFRRIGQGLARFGRGVVRGIGRALPVVQRVAGFLGPFGRIASGAIGAIRGLASGGGIRGALRGLVGGAIPGVGGTIARAALGFDGFDDDAALDALADLADAGRVTPAVAAPVGAALATRVVARAGVQRGTLRRPTLAQRQRMAAAEREFLRALAALPGSIGRRLRLLRFIARASAVTLRRRPRTMAARIAPAAVRAITQRVVPVARVRPQAGARTRQAAARRTAARARMVSATRLTGRPLRTPRPLPRPAQRLRPTLRAGRP
jgi:hypothetical protein